MTQFEVKRKEKPDFQKSWRTREAGLERNNEERPRHDNKNNKEKSHSCHDQVFRKGGRMEIGEVKDLYQASYYLMSGCELVEVKCYEEGQAVNSKLYFRGESIKTLESNWYSRRAMANLWAFRLAYSQIHNYISEAKKKYEGSKRGRI